MFLLIVFQTTSDDMTITEVQGNQQVLLIPSIDSSQTQDATVVIVDGDQISTQISTPSHKEVGTSHSLLQVC